MLQLLYILAFTVIAFFAISNLVRSLITISGETQRGSWTDTPRPLRRNSAQSYQVPHPELLDSNGQPVNEPLLVIRSVSMDDARQRLDSLYNSSPSAPQTSEDDSN